MPHSLLRTRREGHRGEVTSVELFFDLVFVITVSQISHALLAHLTPLGALQAGLLLGAIWWAWIDTAWITNWLEPERTPVKLMLFVLMAIGLVMSSSLPEAFHERGLPFAIAFVVFQLGRTAFMLWAARGNQTLFSNFIRIFIWYASSGVFWLAGGFAEGDMRLWLWLVAVVIDCLAPAMGFWVPGVGRSDTHDWDVDGGHMAERASLFVMIALGESILATGVGFTELEWTFEVIAGMAVSLLASIAMWSIYFGQHARAASHAIEHSADPGRIARQAFTYVPIVIIAGIVVSAVADELVLAHPDGHMETVTMWVLLGGPALFLLGAALFKLAVFGAWSVQRLVGLVVTLALFPVAPLLSPLLLSAITTLIVVAVAVWEAIDTARHPERFAHLQAAHD